MVRTLLSASRAGRCGGRGVAILATTAFWALSVCIGGMLAGPQNSMNPLSFAETKGAPPATGNGSNLQVHTCKRVCVKVENMGPRRPAACLEWGYVCN
jgi:hypothetical protein